MGSSTQKSTTTSGVNNAALNSTITKLAGGISNLYQPGGTSYVAPSSTTTSGWASSLGAANNQDYATGIAGALGSYANRAAGNEIGTNAPGYQAVRDQLQSDITSGVNSSFNNSGLFGSDSNQRGLAQGLASGLGALDYQQYNDSLSRQAEAANMLPSLFAAGQLPSSIQQSVGASQDADAAAKSNGQIDYLSRIAGIINGAAGSAGTTTTTSQPTTPLWQSLLGLGISAL